MPELYNPSEGRKVVSVTPQKISKAIRTHRYYVSIVATILVSVFLPLALIGPLYYKRTLDVVSRQVEGSQLRYLEQCVLLVEMVVDNAIKAAHLLAIDQVFTEYTDYPNRHRLDAARGPYSITEMRDLYNHGELQDQIHERLNAVAQSNDYIDTVYFYDGYLRRVLSATYPRMPVEGFPDAGWLEPWIDALAGREPLRLTLSRPDAVSLGGGGQGVYHRGGRNLRQQERIHPEHRCGLSV